MTGWRIRTERYLYYAPGMLNSVYLAGFYARMFAAYARAIERR